MAIKISGTTVIDDNRNVSSVGIATVGSGSSTTTINGNTGIVNVGTGVTIDGITGNISIAGTISAKGFNIPASVASFNPANGATNVSISLTSITLTFDQVIGIGTTGFAHLRTVSSGGTTLETFTVSQINQNTATSKVVTINRNTASTLPQSENIFFVVDNRMFNTTSGKFAGINTTNGQTYSFTTGVLSLGDSYQGGYLICASGGTRWIAAPQTAEVSRSWFDRGQANTRAQQVSGCSGWFVPSCGQLQNPGFICRTYWDAYCQNLYWSNEAFPVSGHAGCCAWNVSMSHGSASYCIYGRRPANSEFCVRAFRTVSY